MQNMQKKLKNIKIFVFILFIFLFINSSLVFAKPKGDLGFSAIQTKYLDLDINIDIPIHLSNYTKDNSFDFKTFTFYNSRTQDADFQVYYIDSQGNKKSAEIKKDEFGNDLAYFNIEEIKKSEFHFRLEGNIKSENKIVFNTEKYDLKEPIANDNSDENIEIYKQETQYIQSNDSQIFTVTENIKKSNSALEELVNITNWVHSNIEYDLNYGNVVLTSLDVLEKRKGVCDELAILEAAILRNRGFPVKYVVGIANTSVDWGSHAWLEVYVPTQGWIPVDPTYNEVGLVDSSHIVLAKVTDPSECEDRLTTQNNISITFGQKNTNTIINDKKSYSDLGYNNYINFTIDSPERLKSTSLYKLKVNMKNTNANPICFLSNLLVHSEFRLVKPKTSKRLFYLDAFEDKDYTYYIILPNADNAMYYTYKLLSQFSEIEETIIVDPNEDLYFDSFFVLDPVISFKDNNLLINLDIINYTNSQKNIVLKYDINSENRKELIEDSLDINAMQELNFTKPIDINSGSIVFEILGDYEYSKKIDVLGAENVDVSNIDENQEVDPSNGKKKDSSIYTINKDANKYKDLWEDVNNLSNSSSSNNLSIFAIIGFAIAFIGIIVLFIIFKK